MFTFLNSGRKVFYDKSIDYLWYYLTWNYDQEEKICDDINLEEHSNHIDISKYNKEGTQHRLFPASTYIEEYSTYWGPPTHIVDNIYIGSAHNASDYNTFTENNINMVINVTTEISNYYEFNEFLTYFNYPLYDNNKESIARYLEQAYKQILNHQKTNKGNILIHCFMGASRSASIIIYYLMHKENKNGEKYTFDEALEFIREKRKIVNPTFRLTKDLVNAISNSNSNLTENE